MICGGCTSDKGRPDATDGLSRGPIGRACRFPATAIVRIVMPPMQQFTFDVSAEEIPERGQFLRCLLLGPLHPTSKVDYCDPTADE
jgi:hypothetical protein